MKALGEYITRLDEKADTKGAEKHLGTLHGFDLFVRTETGYTLNGKPEKVNAFIVKGDTLTYTHNNGYLSGKTPDVAARQFVRALEKLPALLEHQRDKVENLIRQQTLLTDMAAKPWGKSTKLQELKLELRQVETRLQSVGQEEKTEQQPTKQVTKTHASKQDQSLEIG